MSVRIRLKRTGARKRPFYRIVVMDSRSPRDGRPIEEVGHYSMMLPKQERIHVAFDRVEYWTSKGAQVSETVRNLLKRKAHAEQGKSEEATTWKSS